MKKGALGEIRAVTKHLGEREIGEERKCLGYRKVGIEKWRKKKVGLEDRSEKKGNAKDEAL